jgi:NAD(P)-dependent dehydrogenase (short-subunit alcohol dehydrogenase family)
MSASRNGQPAVIITGSSTGIGAACARELDRRGYRVFAGVRSMTDGRQLQSVASDKLTPVLLDVTDAAAVAAAKEAVASMVEGLGLAGLVNNAGVVVCGPLEVLPLDEIRRQLEVNVIGHIAVTQAFLPLLRVAKGRIVNIGSVNGRLSPPYFGPYAASKFAMEALADALRLELRQTGVRVSMVEPGNVATPIWDKSVAAARQLAERISDTSTGPALELYQRDLDAVYQAAERLCRTAMPVEKVVRAVVHALCSRRPKTRYPVGVQARLGFFAARWLPDPVRDWVVKQGLKLP